MCSNKTSWTFGAVFRRGKIEFSSATGALRARDYSVLPQCGPQLGGKYPPLAPLETGRMATWPMLKLPTGEGRGADVDKGS